MFYIELFLWGLQSINQKNLQVSVKKAMETRKINWNHAYAYLVKHLSVTLQKVIAQNVNKRLINLSSHSSTVNQDPAFHYEAMMDEELLG
jgi:hypothetical protein